MQKIVIQPCKKCGQPEERKLCLHKTKTNQVVCFNCKKERVRKLTRSRYVKKIRATIKPETKKKCWICGKKLPSNRITYCSDSCQKKKGRAYCINRSLPLISTAKMEKGRPRL